MKSDRIPARRKVVIAAVAGVLLGVAAAFLLPWYIAPLLGYDTAALVYLLWTWRRIGELGPAETAAHANREDPTTTQADLALLCAAVASLVAVGLVLMNIGSGSGWQEVLEVVFSVGSVIVSWALVHTIFTLRYAGLFYQGPDGGIDFQQKEPPQYTDFAYLAFTVGMTFQVSDTELNTTPIRAQVLRHALLSYLFGTVIVALTINMVAGLSK